MTHIEQYILYLMVLWHYRAKMVYYKTVLKIYTGMSHRALELANHIGNLQQDISGMQDNLLEMQEQLMAGGKRG